MSTATSLTQRTVSAALWQMASKLFEALGRIVVMIVLARLLAPEVFGLASAAIIVLNFAQTFAQAGVGPALIQRKDIDSEYVSSALVLSLLMGTGFGIAAYFSAGLVAEVFKMPGLVSIVRVMAAVFPVASLGMVAEALLLRNLEFRRIALVDTASFGFGYALVGIAGALLGAGVWALVAAQMAQVALKSAMVLALKRHSWFAKFNARKAGHLLHYGVGHCLAEFGNFVALQGDNFVIGRWLGAANLGLYGRAYTLVSQPARLIGLVFDRVLFPALATVQDDQQRLWKALVRVVGLVSLVATPLSIFMFFSAREVVSVLFGPKWVLLVGPLQMLSLSLTFRTSYKVCDAVARAAGASYKRAWRQWVYAALISAGAIIGVNWGVTGVAAIVCVVIMINFFLMLHLSLSVVDGKWWPIIVLYMRHFGVSAPLGALVSIAVRQAGLNAALGDFWTLTVSALVFGTTYLVAVYLFPAFFGDGAMWIKELVRKRVLGRILHKSSELNKTSS